VSIGSICTSVSKCK